MNSSLIAVHVPVAKGPLIFSAIILLIAAVAFAALVHHRRRKVGRER
ncbi:MAG: hypothetical protein J7L63_00780 [Thermoplasmata archaeon]|nr:hypothetical protein [Thermoplasmata archaeon]